MGDAGVSGRGVAGEGRFARARGTDEVVAPVDDHAAAYPSHYNERYVFADEGDELHGSASFLDVARGMLKGRINPAGLRFVTRTSELTDAGGSSPAVVHRYRGCLAGDEIRFVMQNEGGSSAHLSIEFVARRVASTAPQPGR